MKFHFRGFVSFFLVLAFLALGVSGVVLYLTPRGRVANWTGWTMLGLDKQTWQAIHVDVAVLFLLGALLHLWFNWRVLWCYLKKKAGRTLNMKTELLAATLLAVAVVAGAIFQAPPFKTVTDLNYRVKDYWDRWAADAPAPAPAPHAEELALKTLAANLGLPVEDVVRKLNDEGIAVEDARQSLGQLANENGLAPRDAYAAIRRLFPEAQQQDHGFGQGRGQHRGQQGGHRGRGNGR